MQLLNHLIHAAKKNPARIVVCEAEDPRILTAACRAHQHGLAYMTLVGNSEAIKQRAAEHYLDIQDLIIEDPSTSKKRPELEQALIAHRAHKGMTAEKAHQALNDPLCFGTMLAHCGYADGAVAGAIYSTADVVRSALQLIGKAPEASLVSSFFLMFLDKDHHPTRNGVIFTDCGLVIDPNEEELAAIAIAAAENARYLLHVEPRIAMLSFSSGGSAQHPAVTKVINAAQRVKAALPGVAIDEDVQFDAAIIPEIAAKKLKNSQVKGQANVFVFPNLEAGNIGYKIAERLGGATAIGPLLQGLAKPINDLSRGCSTEDVYCVIAITSLQAHMRKNTT